MSSSNLTRLAVQSYCFREFEFESALRCAMELGINVVELCRVHMLPDLMDPEFRMRRDTLRCADIRVPSFGVEVFEQDQGANRRRFEFAQALGVNCIAADVAPVALDDIEQLTREFSVRVALHNHGPGARYDKVNDVVQALDGRCPLIGACLDTGHAIRSGEDPAEAVRALGPLLFEIHLKDWVRGGEEQMLGEGDLDLRELVAALDEVGFNGWTVFEFELNPNNPVPGLKQCVDAWKQAAGA
ncbi:MAG: sugar phosphate isomerase/epimerase family protein [Candidatus Hydrogenedentota bacterium]